MSKRLITILQYMFFLGLGLFFAWLSLKNVDQTDRLQIQKSLAESRRWLIAPVFLMLVFSHYLRALRWRLLLEPLGHHPGIMNTFFAVLIGYLVNLGVPRLGEVAKCTLLARYEKVPAEQLIGTIITERIIDALTLLLVFALTIGLQPGLYYQLLDTFFPTSPSQTSSSLSWVPLLIVSGIAGSFIIYWFAIKKRTLQELKKAAKIILQRFYAGIASIGALKRRFLFITLTLCIWSLYLLAGYIGFFAFAETARYGLQEALTILSAGSVGMIASPGGIGAYAYLIERSMQLYGLDHGIALAFGWLLWLAQTGVTLITGVLSFILLPWFNKKKDPQPE